MVNQETLRRLKAYIKQPSLATFLKFSESKDLVCGDIDSPDALTCNVTCPLHIVPYNCSIDGEKYKIHEAEVYIAAMELLAIVEANPGRF